MELVRLVYASRPTSEATINDHDRKAFQLSNAIAGISGILVVGQAYFLQWMEGSRREVATLYKVIKSDSRHEQHVVLDYTTVQARRFPKWEMKSINEEVIDHSLLLKYANQERFDPYLMSGDEAVVFFNELGNTIFDQPY